MDNINKMYDHEMCAVHELFRQHPDFDNAKISIAFLH